MIFKVFTRFVIIFTFVQLLTSATPCGFREHENDEMDGNEDHDRKVKRQLEANQLQEVAKEATPDSTKEAVMPEINVIANEEQSNDPLESSEGQGAGNGELAQDPVPEIQIPEIPEIDDIATPSPTREELPKNETDESDYIDDIAIPAPTRKELPKNETDESDDIRPIPINHRLSPDTTILGKIKNMFSKVKTWLVGS